MKIHAHILAWNEADIIPFTLEYYSGFCDKIFVYDNCSDDETAKICGFYSMVQVIKWKGDNGMNDAIQSNIKSQMYREKSRNQGVDWVIVVDCDEFLYHPNLIEKLSEFKAAKIDIPTVIGYDMVSTKFPSYKIPIIEQVKFGAANEFLNKNIVFNPEKDIQYGIGAHTIYAPNCNFNKINDESNKLMLIHYKFLSLEYVVNRYQTLLNRQSAYNKSQKFNTHYSVENAKKRFNDLLLESKKVI